MNSKVDVKAFGKVAMLFGGSSAERDISLQSGQAVFKALQTAGVSVDAIDPAEVGSNLVTELSKYDRVFLMLHGRGGEDGVMQGLLEYLNIPYTGSGVLASALAMDKLRTKQLWQSLGIPTPKYWIVNEEAALAEVDKELVYPLAVKPNREGSSIGITKVQNRDELEASLKKAAEFDTDLLIEQWIEGSEYTVAVLNGEALPVIRLQPQAEFYDYDAKYVSDETKYLIPSGLPDQQEAELKALCVKAFNALGCEGWGRVDVMQDDQGKFYLLEVNTAPGMTSHSLVPMAAKASGFSFEDLVVDILKGTLD